MVKVAGVAPLLLQDEERAFIYRWFARFFTEEIKRSDLEAYRSDAGAVLLMDLNQFEPLKPICSAISKISKAREPDQAIQMKLAVAFARLFLGTTKQCALPYQSIYQTDEGLYNRRPAQEMDELLRQMDLGVKTGFAEPSDHISIQLNVMAAIIEKRHDERPPDMEGNTSVVCCQIAYLKNHILSWTPAFAKDCEAYDPSRFYGAAAKSLVSFAQADLLALQQRQREE